MASRYRTREKISTPVKTVQKYISGGNPFPDYVTNTNSWIETEGMFDQLTPGYPDVTLLPQNELIYLCTSMVERPGYLLWASNNNTRIRSTTGCISQWLFTPSSGNGQGFIKLTPPLPANAASKIAAAGALVKARALGKFSKSEYAFREPIAELGRTIVNIKHPIQLIKRVVTRFQKARHRDPDKYKNDAKALAELWLTYSLSVSPNLGTINDALEAYTKRKNKRRTLKSVYSIEKLSFGPLFASGNQSPSLTGTSRAERLYTYEVKAGIFYSQEDADQTSGVLGLRPRDLPGLGWELLPLSFVIDRLYNVKRMIDSIAALNSRNLRILGGYVTTKSLDRTKRFITNLAVSGSNKPSPADSPPLYEETFNMGRSRWDPSAFDALPPLKMAGLIDSLHSTADTISLIITRLRK